MAAKDTRAPRRTDTTERVGDSIEAREVPPDPNAEQFGMLDATDADADGNDADSFGSNPTEDAPPAPRAGRSAQRAADAGDAAADDETPPPGAVPHAPTLTLMDPVQIRRMQQAQVLADAENSTIDEAPQPGGVYIVNGRKVDAFGKPVKAGGRRFAEEE